MNNGLPVRLSVSAHILRLYGVMTPVTIVKPRSVGHSDTGRVRASNQDAILVDEASGLWLVADGMGGHAGGAEASDLARATVQAAITRGARLEEAILEAHRAICEHQQQHPDKADMGTTIVALRERDGGYEIVWVGDSRAYAFDGRSELLEMLTRDHNLPGRLVEAGAISQSEANRHPRRHVLTDCLGLQSETGPRIDRITGQWRCNEMLLLCSDGLSGELDDAEIVAILGQDKPLESLACQLMKAALAAGARDNVSLILVRAPEALPPAPSPGGWLTRLGQRFRKDR